MKELLLFAACAFILSVFEIRKRFVPNFLVFACVFLFVCFRALSFFLFLDLKILPSYLFSFATATILYGISYFLSTGAIRFYAVVFGISTSILFGFWFLGGMAFAFLLGLLFYLAHSIFEKRRKNPFVHNALFSILCIPFISSGMVLFRLLFF